MHIMAFDACAARLNRIGQDVVEHGYNEASIKSFRCDMCCGYYKGIDLDEFLLLWNLRRRRQIGEAKKSWALTIMDDWTSKTCTNCDMAFNCKAQFEYAEAEILNFLLLILG